MKKCIINFLNNQLIVFFVLILLGTTTHNVNAQYYQHPVFDSLVIIPENPKTENYVKSINYTTHFRSGCTLDSTKLQLIGSDFLKLHLWFSTGTDTLDCHRVDTVSLLPGLLVGNKEIIVDLVTFSSFDTIVDTIYTSFEITEEDLGLKTDESSFSNINLYPNPVQNQLKFSVQSNAQQVEVEIYDITGKRVVSQQFSNTDKGKFQNSIDVSTLQYGLYLCRFSNGSKVITRKFVKE